MGVQHGGPPPALRNAVRRVRRVRARLEAWEEERRRTCWPTTSAWDGPRPRIAAVTVNYDTPELTSQLVFSLMRVLDPQALTRIVVVENSPVFDATGVLRRLDDAGIVTLLRRRSRPYHGPGLNDALSYLAQQQAGERPVDLIWVLDSDVIALRPEALHAAVAGMTNAGAVLAGEVRSPYRLTWPHGHVTTPHEHTYDIWQPHWAPSAPPEGVFDGPHPRFWPYAHISSLVLDPGVVWRSNVPPFREDGEPGIEMQAALHRQGLRVVDVPFFRDALLLHLGRGTSFAIRDRKQWRNRYYRWSRNENSHHYESSSDGVFLHLAFMSRFRREVPVDDANLLVEACLRPERLSFLIDAS